MRLPFLISFLFCNLISVGQNQFSIDYPFPVDTVINFTDSLGKEKIYDIDFVNKAGQTVKNRHRMIMENHQSKRGYDISDNKTYFIYKNSLLDLEFTFSFNGNYLNKTEYEYNKSGKLIKATFYFYTKKLSGDTMAKFKSSDFYLINPFKIPQTGWSAYRIDKRDYNEAGNIVYKGYFLSGGKSNKIEPDREQYFTYNDRQQLIEHISLTRKKCKDWVCGTDMMQTFEYDCNGKLVRKNWYEDGRYQAYGIYTYSDSSIIEKNYTYSYTYGEFIKGKTNPYAKDKNPFVQKYIYDKKTKEYIEETYKSKFRICNDAE